MWSKTQAWEMCPNGWPDCGMVFLTQLNEDTIYLWWLGLYFCVGPTLWEMSYLPRKDATNPGEAG